MDFLIYPPAFLLAVMILVTVHEFGHYLVARASGVRILRFSVGFGRPLLTWTNRDGTEFVIAAIPLGGYVRMLDERDHPGATVSEEPAEDSYQRLNPWWRIAIAAGGPGANVVLAVLLFAWIALLGVHYLVPYTLAPKAESPAAQAGLPAGVRITGIDDRTVESWRDISLALAHRLGDDGVVAIRWQGRADASEQTTEIPIQDWLGSAAEPDFIGEIGLQPAPVVVGEVVSGSAAERAGLQTGDLIAASNGQPVQRWSEWVATVRDAPGERLNLSVLRNGEAIEVAATPDKITEDGVTFGRIGVGTLLHSVAPGPLGAISHGAVQTWEHSTLVVSHFGKLITGSASPRTVAGPLSIAQFAGDSLVRGLRMFLNLLAFLSVSLAIVNLLPVPLLDGGHIVFALWEAVTGSAPSERVQMAGLQVGLFFVGCLMLLSISNDFLRLF